jgi:hypothetical protein
VVPEHLDELRHSGWIAVVHADGNGVGGLFRGFLDHVAHVERTDRVTLATHVRYQRAVARELDESTWAAVRDAVAALFPPRAEPHGPPAGAGEALTGRLLPIVVGGDDVTVACDAALAVPFVQAFAAAFARHTAAQPTLSGITRAATGRAGLTVSAGIAVVKLHHPFSTAYELAEALTVSAKQIRHGDQALSGFDLHVAHTSTLRDLAGLREYVLGDDGTPIARHAGPYLLGDPTELPEPVRHRSVALLDEITGWLDPDPTGWLSATQAHALREAADRGLAEYRHHLDRVTGRAGDPDRARALLTVQSPSPGPDGPPPFLRLFDALHLRGLRLGTAAAAASEAASTPAGGTR